MSENAQPDPMLQWVSFRLDQEIYAIDVMLVQEVRRHTEIAPVPGADSDVMGIINLRGSVVTVIDTRKRLGHSCQPLSDDTRIVIVEHQDEVIGLYVDEVSEVIYLRQSEIERSPKVSNDEARRYISGVCNKGERLYILLAVDKLLGANESEGLASELELF